MASKILFVPASGVENINLSSASLADLYQVANCLAKEYGPDEEVPAGRSSARHMVLAEIIKREFERCPR